MVERLREHTWIFEWSLNRVFHMRVDGEEVPMRYQQSFDPTYEASGPEAV